MIKFQNRPMNSYLRLGGVAKTEQ